MEFALPKIIAIENNVEKAVIGNFYSNPSKGKVNIEITTLEKGTWKLTTYDLYGKEISRSCKFLENGINKITLNKLNQGVNFVRFENGIVSEIQKVIKEYFF